MTAPLMCGPDRPIVRLAITGDRNRPGKSDYTGAFRPEARIYTQGLGRPPAVARIVEVSLGQGRPERRRAVLRAIAEHRPTELAFFCHGSKLSIELGFDTTLVDRLAEALAEAGCSRVGLYACLTALDPRRGFAARLRDAMVAAGLEGVRVLGHAQRGHSSRNPLKVLFEGTAGSPGELVVAPGSPLWRTWRARQAERDDPIRWQVLDRSPEEIRAELAS